MLPPHAADSPRNPIRVLLIEDDPADRDLFVHRFQECAEHAELEHACDVEDAWRRLERAIRAPDLIFVDLHLPGVPATEFIEWIRSRSELANVLTIAITGNPTHASAGPTVHGVPALLLKPIAADDISALITLAQARRT